MSALAAPTAPVRQVPAGPQRARGHLRLVGSDDVAVLAARRPESRPAARPAVRLTARGRRARSLLLLTVATGLAVAGGGWLGGSIAEAQSSSGPVERVSVGAGETVWGIAAATAAEGQDVREVVDDILRLNGLSSGDVDAGQQLLVPAG